MTAQTPEGTLGAFSHGEHPIFAQLAQMNMDTLPNSELDPRTYHIARLAALIAMEAAPASYLANLAEAREAGLTVQDAQGVCVAIAPIVGSARVVDAAGNVLRAFGLAEAATEYVAEEEVKEEAGLQGEAETGGGVAAGAATGGAAGAAAGIPGQRREDAPIEQRSDQTVEGRGAERDPVGEESVTEERFVGGPEQGTPGDVPSGEAPGPAVAPVAAGQRAEEGARGTSEKVQGTVPGAKDKLEEEPPEYQTIEEMVRGRIRGWMKRGK